MLGICGRSHKMAEDSLGSLCWRRERAKFSQYSSRSIYTGPRSAVTSILNCRELCLARVRRFALRLYRWRLLLLCVLLLQPVLAVEGAATPPPPLPEAARASPDYQVRDQNMSPLSEQIEELKQAALELNRDLLILEEDLLFPANTQVAVYVSVDVGFFFQLDAVQLKIGDQLVASHLYNDKQNSALNRGGIQRLYLGNLKTGRHEITAFFHGYGPEPQKREYKRGASYVLNKEQNSTMLEIRIQDSEQAMQPEFDFKEWQL